MGDIMETKTDPNTLGIKCTICDKSDLWKNVDEYRFVAGGMCICMGCGFITYPEVIAHTEDLTKFYEEEYREAPSAQNVFTGQRKLHYHAEFLRPLFEEYKKTGKAETLVVGEQGAAFGLFLKWIKDCFPKAQVYGTELTLTFRRNAWWEYQIPLTKEFDTSRKYDLICSYKVAEHIPNIQDELLKMKGCLAEGGYLYISVPTWFETLSNFGVDGFSLDYYYHKNHINVWSRPLFEALLAKLGLNIVRKNTVFYDATYLCQVAKEGLPYSFDDPIVTIDKLARIKKASLAFDMAKYSEAIEHWPNFPDAQLAAYENNRKKMHDLGFDYIHETVIKKGLAACPESSKMTIFCADLCMRYNKWELALEYVDKCLKQKPLDPGCFMALGQIYRQMAETTTRPEEKAKFFTEARDITRYLKQTSFQHVHEATNWIFADNAKIPMPSELT